MLLTTQKALREAVKDGSALVYTYELFKAGVLPDRRIAYSSGKYGVNGAMFIATDNNTYVVVGRSSLLFIVL